MSEVDPLDIEVGTKVVVNDSDSQYDGTEGRVLQVYDDKLKLELDVFVGCGKLSRDFDVDQLEYPE